MNKIIKEFEYVTKEIPNLQVKATADQFLTAAELLSTQPIGSRVVIPEIVNYVLAIELYLKSLSSYSVIKDLKKYPDGVSGGVVTVIPSQCPSTHKLSTLFDSCDIWIKDELEKYYIKSPLSNNADKLNNLLVKYDKTFVDVRYIHENSDTFCKTNINELKLLALFIKNCIEILPRETVVIK